MDNFSALVKLDEFVSSIKEKREKSKTRDAIVIAFAILSVVAAVAGTAYTVYRFVTPAEDEFDDDFDGDFNDNELIAFGDEDEEDEKDAKTEDKK